MKLLLGLFLILTMVELYAAEIRVKKMLPDEDMERSFVLSTNLPEKVVIDCQSFIQGLRIGEFENAHTYMLAPEDCEGLQVRVKSTMKLSQEHCIEVEEDIRSDYTCR